MDTEEAGFSLIELLVVMVITFFIAGAIYGLLTSGQNAFRREPEVADRQQNIRVAMDLITKDIENAGSGLPAFVQIFTGTDPGAALNNLNGGGPAGAMGAAAAALRSTLPTADGVNSDILELIATDDRCPAQTVCTVASPTTTITTREPNATWNPICFTPPGGFSILTDNINMTIQPVVALVPNAPVCPGSAANTGLSLGAAMAVSTNPIAPTLTPPDLANGITAFLYPGKVVRYMIATNPDPADPVPTLWRSVTGRFKADGTGLSPAPGVAGSVWQLVARGIEDLQVEYLDGSNVWQNSPALVTSCLGPPTTCDVAAKWVPIVRQVRVTLSARVAAFNSNLQGAQVAGNAAAAPNSIRGQLVSITQPRAALTALVLGDQMR